MKTLHLLWHYKARFAFFFLGLLFQLAGLFIGNSDNLPNIYRFISPAYFHARQGVTTLIAHDVLTEKQVGYRELSAILVAKTKEKIEDGLKDNKYGIAGAQPNWGSVKVVGNITFNEYLVFPQGQPPVMRAVFYNLSCPNFDFSKLNLLSFDILTVKEEVESLKGPGIWMSGLFIFFLGSVVAFLALFREIPESNTTHPVSSAIPSQSIP